MVATAKFTLLDGEGDGNGGGVGQLHDGKVPNDANELARNLLPAGTSVGRILVDLKRVAEINQINTSSWHPARCEPQVYKFPAALGGSPLSKARDRQLFK